jgi:hypothetical protein
MSAVRLPVEACSSTDSNSIPAAMNYQCTHREQHLRAQNSLKPSVFVCMGGSESDPWALGDSDVDDGVGPTAAAATATATAATATARAAAATAMGQGSLSRSPLQPQPQSAAAAAVRSCSRSRSRSPLSPTHRFFPQQCREAAMQRTEMPPPPALPGTEWYTHPLWRSLQHRRAMLPAEPSRPMAHEALCCGTLMEGFGFQVLAG